MNDQNIEILKIFNKETRTKYFTFVLFILSISSIIFFSDLINKNMKAEKISQEIRRQAANPFNSVKIIAKSAYVLDVAENKEMYSKDSNKELPLASITKVMTALTLRENSDITKTQISSDSLRADGDSGLKVGESWNTKDLNDFTLVSSSNDGALALASVINYNANQNGNIDFINLMNVTAKKIGMTQSKFYNPHGLDFEDKAGAYGTSKDLATLFEYTIKNYPDLLEATKYQTISVNSDLANYKAENTNVFTNDFPDLIASKTGFTDLAGGNLVIAFDAGINRPIIVSVLGSTQEGRFEDALKLVGAARQYIKMSNIENNDNN